MASENLDTSIVSSAVAVAALRAASALSHDTAVRNPDYLARHFISLKFRLLLSLPHAALRELVEKMVPGGYCYFLARAKFFDEKLISAIEDGIEQVVILGAGFDTRAHRFKCELGNRRIFELDLAKMQRYKKEKLAAINTPQNKNVEYAIANFLNNTLHDVLSTTNFDPARSTIFLIEGLSYYLPPEIFRSIVAYSQDYCSSKNQLVFDYSTKAFVQGDTSTYGSENMAKWLKKNNEPFLFGLEPMHAKRWLNDNGFVLKEQLSCNDIVEQYLIDSKGNKIGQPLGYLQLTHSDNNRR